MKEPLKLSIEEKLLLEKLPLAHLQFFRALSEDKNFPLLKDLVNYLINDEKNFVLGLNTKNPNEALYEIAYARGGIKILRKLVEIILGSKQEIANREEERKKRK